MLSLTHAARQFISDMLTDSAHGIVLRISDSPEGPQIEMDRVRVGDNTFDCNGKCVLAIDQMVLRVISGQKLDVDTVDGQPKLTLTTE